MIRILHAADFHLDSPFAALAPEQAAQRREEQRQLVRRLAEECGRLNCQLLLLAGDLFDSEQVYRETTELLLETLGGLKAQVFIAPGNHDPWTLASPYVKLSWPDNVHIFHSKTVESVKLEELGVIVYGAAFTEPHETGLLGSFLAHATDAPKLMVIHGTLDDPASPYNPISEKEILASGLDYLALGHVHQREIRTVGKTTVVNPGCPMGRGFDETGHKGVCYVELDRGVCKVTPLDLGARVYETLSVSVGEDPLADIQAALPENTERDLYRITLTGCCPPPNVAALKAALARRFYALELIDRTTPPSELWRDIEENSLKGEYLRQLKACYDGDEDQRTRGLVVQAVRIGLALMEGREVPEL